MIQPPSRRRHSRTVFVRAWAPVCHLRYSAGKACQGVISEDRLAVSTKRAATSSAAQKVVDDQYREARLRVIEPRIVR